MNSISVPTDMNKNTDTAAMELMIGNMNLRISNETDGYQGYNNLLGIRRLLLLGAYKKILH